NLYQYWHDRDNKNAAAQRLGRDTWIHWTWGNQKVLRRASVLAGNLPVPVSIDLFRMLDSRNRKTRFRDLGLVNEPYCEATDTPDEYGLFLDRFKGDPLGYYPVSARDRKEYHKDPKNFPWKFGDPVKAVQDYYPLRYPPGTSKEVD